MREWIPHVGPLTRVIHLNLFLDIVPSSSGNSTRAVFPRCVFSRRKQRMWVMADRASSKRKFEVTNAPSNKRKKTNPNLFCRSGPREHDEFSKGQNCCGFVWWWLKTGYAVRFEEAHSAITLIRCSLHENTQRGKIARVKFPEELGTMSKIRLRWITLLRGPIWGIHSLLDDLLP